MSANSRALARSFTLVAALFTLQRAAFAADSADDVQQQIRNVLSGAGAAPAARVVAPTAAAQASPDVQELARRLLLGTSGAHPAPVAGDVVREHGDVQMLAQRVLLGHGTSAKGS